MIMTLPGVEVRGERLFNKDGDGQDLSSSYSRQNVTVRYQRKPEKITVDGPLTTDIKLQVKQNYKQPVCNNVYDG